MDQFKISMNQDILSTILHAMANLCSANTGPKKTFVNHRLFTLLVDAFQVSQWPPEVDAIFAWLFSNILVPEEHIGSVLDFDRENAIAAILCRIILKYQYGSFPEIDIECLWGISSYLSIKYNQEERITNILGTKFAALVVLVLKKHAVEGGEAIRISPILRIVGTFTTLNNEVIDHLMDYDMANVLFLH